MLPFTSPAGMTQLLIEVTSIIKDYNLAALAFGPSRDVLATVPAVVPLRAFSYGSKFWNGVPNEA